MWGGGGGWEICDECSWTPRPGGELPMVGLKGPKVGGVGGGGGEIGPRGEFKSQCLVEGWGRARTSGEHDHLD